MLVAISGSQGSGKSTIINRIRQLGYETIERKTSRSILTDWNVTLQEVNSNPNMAVKFQEEISRRKHEDELVAVHSDQLWFTERTHADLFTYALVTLGNNNDYSEWINKYYTMCMSYNQNYSLVYYLRAGHFKPEHDGVRGSNHHYSRMVDLTMLDMTQQMVHTSRLTVVETPDLEQRVSLITAQALALTH